MPSMKDFAKRARELGHTTLPKGVDKKMRRTGLAIFQQVAIATPVDTGRARSNWAVGLGEEPDLQDAPPFVPGEGGSTAAQNAQMAIAAAHAAMSDRRPGQDIYISNNLAYIGALNDGSSAQAPAGFVQQAVQYGQKLTQNDKVLDGDKK